MKKSMLMLLLVLISVIGLSAHDGVDYSNLPEMSDYRNDRVFVETPPPVGPVRPVGEFEPASQVLIRYPLGIPVALVAQFANITKVVCLVGSTSTQNQATTAFQNAGVNMSNVIFLVASTDTYWTRDYGPMFIFDGNDELGIVDFPYNRPRPNDDEIPRTFALTYDYPLYGMNLIQTGGNYMSDGHNTVAQTTLVYDENPSQTQQQIYQKMHNYLGISSYFVVQDPNNTYIDHIDCWGKFLAPDKVLIRSVPTTHAQYNAIEATANYFAGQNCVWGYPYRVYRVNTPQNQPYTNSVVLNNTVFVPIMNSSYDAAALQVYSNALPGYNVVGVIGSSSTPWESTDALHCRAHEIPDKQMLYVSHQPYFGEIPLQENINFSTVIKPYSLMPLYSDSIFVSYKINQSQWYRAYLTNATDFNYSTFVGNLAPGDTIRYFIHAADQSGRSINHPITGALDPHIFRIAPDTVPPNIAHTPITVLTNDQIPVTLTAIVTDNFAVNNVQLVYKIDDGPERTLDLEEMDNNTWAITFEPALPAQADFMYYKIVAYDHSNPANVSFAPLTGWYDVLIDITANEDDFTPVAVFALDKIYPNPFNLKNGSPVTVSYSAKANTGIQMSVYNIKGQLINSVQTYTKSNGKHVLLWNGRDKANQSVPSGVYYLHLESAEGSYIRKLLILK